MMLGQAGTSSSSKVLPVCLSQVCLPSQMRFLFVQLELLSLFFRGSSSLKLESSLIKMYPLIARISQLCSNGLDGSLIQMNLVVLGGIIPMFLGLASRDMFMFLPHELKAAPLGASEFRVLHLHAVMSSMDISASE